MRSSDWWSLWTKGIHTIEQTQSLREMSHRWRRCSMGSCLYVAALDDLARPSRSSSNTTAVCHALRLDGRTRVCFEVCAAGGAPESSQPRRERPPARADDSISCWRRSSSRRRAVVVRRLLALGLRQWCCSLGRVLRECTRAKGPEYKITEGAKQGFARKGMNQKLWCVASYRGKMYTEATQINKSSLKDDRFSPR